MIDAARNGYGFPLTAERDTDFSVRSIQKARSGKLQQVVQVLQDEIYQRDGAITLILLRAGYPGATSSYDWVTESLRRTA